MNAGAHIAVADRTLDHRAEAAAERAAALLGAALPDLATMGRFRLVGTTTDAAVTRGIALHHRTDDLFHSHPWFRERNAELTAELQAAGLDRGPAMACSHVGIELLLDGRLGQEAVVRAANGAAFDAIEDLGPALGDLVRPDIRTRWLHHLGRLSRHRLPDDYGDPQAVAHRLFRILSTRPRLALPAEGIDDVAGALAARKASIDVTALALVEELADELAATVGVA